ncbi:MAG: sugar phosphate nucleotidyltransferase, partial [Pseudomonadota bacterium]
MTKKFAHHVGPSPKIMAVVLAGGEGKRLMPLTRDRAKPAVPFGGCFRIIDFVLSNLINSGIHRIKVITQYKSDSLVSHLSRSWRLSALLNHYVEPVPAQQRLGKQWFRGSADAIYQSLNVVVDEDPDLVCVFGGDHIYKMDVRQMIGYHINKGADMTVVGIPIKAEDAHDFGVIKTDKNGRLVGFEEKPDVPEEIPGRPGWVMASMGSYVFDPDLLREAVTQDSLRDTAHDFGQNILPMLHSKYGVYVYNFLENEIVGTEESERGYWRDVGTIESYWNAS